MKRNFPQARHRKIQIRVGPAHSPSGQNLPHGGGHGHPTPVIPKPRSHAISEIMQMRVLIGGGGNGTAPLKLPTHPCQLRKELDRPCARLGETGPCGLNSIATARAHHKTPSRIHPKIGQEPAGIRRCMASRQDVGAQLF